MNTVVIILVFMTFCVMLAVAVRVLKARRLRELLAARRAKYNLNFAERRRHVQTVRGRQVEDLDEEEILAYQQRDTARDQNIHFLRLLVADSVIKRMSNVVYSINYDFAAGNEMPGRD